jgi:hypothetical protein
VDKYSFIASSLFHLFTMLAMVGVRTGGHFSFLQLEIRDEGSQYIRKWLDG